MPVRPLAVQVGVGVGLAAAAAYAFQWASGGIDSLFPSDADLFRRVATDPFGSGAAIDAPELYGDAYRYGRILYPLLAWVVALGRSGWVPWTLLLLGAVGLGLAAACAVELLGRRGVGQARMLWLAAVPAVWLGVRGAFSEWPLLGLLLLGLLLEIDGRRLGAAVTFSLALLGREALALALVPMAVRDFRAAGWRGLRRWAVVASVPAAWHLWVWVRVGSFPVFDPSLSRREAVDWPVRGLLTAFGEQGATMTLMLVAGLGLVTVIAATVIAVRRPWHPVTAAAMILALTIVVFGPNVWRFSGEALRTMMYALVLTAVAVVAAWGGAPPEGEASPDAPGR
ncbi:MAG: hypothetical protein ACE5GC_06990 [Acidimicrobiia bacterium]